VDVTAGTIPGMFRVPLPGKDSGRERGLNDRTLIARHAFHPHLFEGMVRLACLLQRFTLTCGREERFSIADSLLPRASIVNENK
jgi:hypothetical protein